MREVARRLTQAELIAQALDNEEGNIIEHRNYLSQEEEKRRRAQVVRKSISGPVLRFISKVQNVELPVDASSAQPSGTSSAQETNVPRNFSVDTPHTLDSTSHQPIFMNCVLPTNPSVQSFDNTIGQSPISSIEPPLQEPPQIRTEKVAKNYLIHELGQTTGISRPSWENTMRTVFGDHAQWETLQVYTSKNRPYGKYYWCFCILIHSLYISYTFVSARPVVRCPITGRVALYCDPRTGVPFANQYAYDTLTRLLAHEYIWDNELQCYTG